MPRSRFSRYDALVFATGAVTLSLEVLASRIMTPYFGVSLYIWTGILSITLVFLALGYGLGGRVAARCSQGRLEVIFLTLPVVAASAILLACIIYPWLFPQLAAGSLLVGSFVAGTVLLATPLVALSALNPLLIAWRQSARPVGDAGAGRVFFLSTIGSVLGVLLTAFGFIPHITNFCALLLLGIGLSGASLCLVGLSIGLSRRARRSLIGAGVAVAALSTALLLGKARFLPLLVEAPRVRERFVIKAEYTSIFGNIKVVQVALPGGEEPFLVLLQDGLVQNRVTPHGVSLSSYTHVLSALAHGFVPTARQALVLGLGAGIVPRHLKRDGMDVSVVEINPDALRAATAFFHFDPRGINLHVGDARTFVRRCVAAFDVVVIDLFQGDGTPDYLLTREFFQDVRACVRPAGAMVMNAFFDGSDEGPNRRLLATVAMAFPYVFEFRTLHSNAYITASSIGELPPAVRPLPGTPPHLVADLNTTLASGRRYT
ncbi:MAG TPA: fused MFS/spermidine synthase, partial [Candidatus Tectomicrobia bacterium]